MDEDFLELSFTSGNYSAGQKCEIDKTFTHHFLSSVYLIVFIIGLFGNVFGLWNMCLNWKKWTSSNVFVLNLGIADLFYVITLPFFVFYYKKEEVWMFGFGFCRLARCLFHVNMYASISFLTCISVQRYLGIVHPMKMIGRFQSLRSSLYISILVWIWVIIQVMPNLLFTNTHKNRTYCHDSTINEELSTYMPYTMVITFTGFLVPFFIIVVCYIRVLTVLAKNKNIDTNIRTRSITLVFIIMVLFSVCFFPYYILRNINLLSRAWQLRGICTQTLKNLYISYQVTRGLASMNSAINPLLYLVTNENFVSKFRRMRKSAWYSFTSSRRTKSNPDIKSFELNASKEAAEASEGL
ncbi:P2Y purinoceptor 1-like [Rhinophrynus dorsalis]